MVEAPVDASSDPVLEILVQQVHETLDAPIVLASVVLGYTRFFRVGVGLPPSMDAREAAEACDTLCNLVVREERPWFAEDVATTDGLPIATIEAMGARSYLGHPVYLRQRVVGALCALDVRPRAWTQAEWERLAGLAGLVSSRVDTIGGSGLGARQLREREDLLALIRLAGGLGDGPPTLEDARTALSVLGQPLERLFALQHDRELRHQLEQALGVDLSGLIDELQHVGASHRSG